MLSPNNLTTCERCGRVFGIGDWYQCPHEPLKEYSVIGDEIPGGETCENYGPNPVTFYSETERRTYMSAHGLQRAERWCPTPGTDTDPAGVQNPRRYIDPVTLANARALLSRVTARDDEYITLSIRNVEVHVMDEAETKELIDAAVHPI